MARPKTTIPQPTREKGERNLDLPVYLDRYLPIWRSPDWLDANKWRVIVANQPVAIVCRETLVSYIIALDWKIEPRDSTMRDEYKDEIEYYTKFISSNRDYDYVDVIEWIGKDFLDIPFGGAAELGRRERNDKVWWIDLLDGSTLYPTLNNDYPVAQVLRELPTNVVYFPYQVINRIYYSPRSDIKRKGWGFAPPEMIYLALELLNRGDTYYANLLLDTPQVGILDLADMEKDSAEDWVKSWRSLLTGIDPFKIPVLYQHEKPATFIPFTKSPVELMFDKAVSKYSSLVAAAYGMSLSDIGVQATTSGGETLAGSIRQERRTRKSGFARMKRKFESFFNFILPEYLKFVFIDLDDEESIAKGRARLASATALTALIDKRIISPQEGRLQIMSDGLMTISMPEELPPDSEFPEPTLPFGASSPERPSMLGRPVAVSAGGQGEVRNSEFEKQIDTVLNLDDIRLNRLIKSVYPIIELETKNIVDILEDDNLHTWNTWHDEILWSGIVDGIPELTLYTINKSEEKLKQLMDADDFWRSPNFKSLANDLAAEFRSIRNDALRKRAIQSYESGETNALVTDFPVSSKEELKFVSKTTSNLRNLWNISLLFVRKSVISGVREFLTLQNVDISVDNSLVNTIIRSKLVEIKTQLLEKLAEVIIDTAYDIMEKQNDNIR